MESEGPDEPLEGIKRAKSGTRIKVLEVFDGFFYIRGPIKLPPLDGANQQVVLG